MKCYLDNAATTPLNPDVKEYLISMLDVFGNPSSSHSEGIRSKRLIEDVRGKVARFINAESPSNVYFTSSGSASNTLGIQGFALSNQCTILYPKTLHKSALKTIDALSKYYDINTIILEVDSYGNINIDYLKQVMQLGCSQKLAVLEYANSEIGTVQNVKEISEIVHQYNGVIFVDCTGSISTIPLDVIGLNIDMASFSAHKIGSLKGVGVLYKKDNIELMPLIYGSQENGLFAGTENLFGILSLGAAIDLITYDKTSNSRDFVWNNIKNIQEIYLIGASLEDNRLLNNLYVCIRGIKGSDLVAMMDDVYGTQISTGSACNNGSPIPSSVLLAIGINKEDLHSCIRISFSGNESQKELDEFCKNLRICIKMIRDSLVEGSC